MTDTGIYTPLTSALQDGWLTPPTAALPMGSDPIPTVQENGRGPWAGLGGRGITRVYHDSIPGPSSPSATASRCTDYAILYSLTCPAGRSFNHCGLYSDSHLKKTRILNAFTSRKSARSTSLKLPRQFYSWWQAWMQRARYACDLIHEVSRLHTTTHLWKTDQLAPDTST